MADAAVQHQHAPSAGKSGRQKGSSRRILTHSHPSNVGSIADAVVIKDDDLFILSDRLGQVPFDENHGLGLYHHDCRFLSGYTVKVCGQAFRTLGASSVRGHAGLFQMSIPDLRSADGRPVPRLSVGAACDRVADGRRRTVTDRFALENYGSEPVELELSFDFRADFDDIFVVRGMWPADPGHARPPEWKDGALWFACDGADGVHRSLSVRTAPPLRHTRDSGGDVRVSLASHERRELHVTMTVAESRDARDVLPPTGKTGDADHVAAESDAQSRSWLAGRAELRIDGPLYNEILHRSLLDLNILSSRLDGDRYFCAGIPWFGTLFGRDSVISALQTLFFDPDIARDTARLLARHQGRKVDEWKDEQPGKILHELRRGELANMGEVPYTPFYGSVDATPLYLILIARHAAWTGSLELFQELRGSVEAALEWIDRYGDSDGDGYVDYSGRSDQGLINQGWKDSGNAIVQADGSLAEPPIALPEVQAYVYQAKHELADLFRRAGDPGRADRLAGEAADLKARFNRDFWDGKLGTYVLALQAGGRPCRVVASNAGHALWTGIAEPDKARRVMERLMADDMFSGWGVRTLSEREKAFNPVGYHLGTVWPHDNSIIASGFRRYGFDEAAGRIFGGITGAATHFGQFRLPEVFAGFSRNGVDMPARYPVACHPQAWAAGSVPYMFRMLLGLSPQGFENRLFIDRPVLPDAVHRIDLLRLRVARATVDLRFERTKDGAWVRVLNCDGPLEVVRRWEPGDACAAPGPTA